MCEDYNNLDCLYKRSLRALHIINGIIDKTNKKQHAMNLESLYNNENDTTKRESENTSYLDMSMRKYESYDMVKTADNSNRNDYVDVIGKASKEFIDDDNIYDNYMVERSRDVVHTTAPMQSANNTAKKEASGRQECPFNGLPAAHLTIMHSPKCGWLTMHLRGKRFIRHFSVNFRRKYYTGLVMKESEPEQNCEWWLLMYAGGTSDLKPTVCLPLNQFEVNAEHLKDKKDDAKAEQCDNKRNLCKFELNEKTTKKDGKSFCFVAETVEHREHWFNLLKQLCIGLPYVENLFAATAQIRKLPMLPLNKSMDMDRMRARDTDTVDNTKDAANMCNYSEGVYEEPEEYYKNVPTLTTPKAPTLPAKMSSQSTASTIRADDISSIYDTPKKPIRRSNDAKKPCNDSISDQIDPAAAAAANESRLDSVHDNRRLKIDDDIRYKLSTQLKEQSQKYLSTSGREASDDDQIIKNPTTFGTDSATTKYQLSSMRKWLFSNHFSKLRQSNTQSANFTRATFESGGGGGGGGGGDEATSPTTTQLLHKTNPLERNSNVQQRTKFSVQPKGNKVHMIINQLEANGQLTLLSGGTSTNKCITSV